MQEGCIRSQRSVCGLKGWSFRKNSWSWHKKSRTAANDTRAWRIFTASCLAPKVWGVERQINLLHTFPVCCRFMACILKPSTIFEEPERTWNPINKNTMDPAILFSASHTITVLKVTMKSKWTIFYFILFYFLWNMAAFIINDLSVHISLYFFNSCAIVIFN